MTRLRPLLECTDDDLTRELLSSAGSELPRPTALRNAALALGFTAATANALAATLPATASVAGGGSTIVAAALSAEAGGVAASSAASGGALACGAAAGGAVASTATYGALGSASLGMVAKSVVGGALLTFLSLTAVERSLGEQHSSTSVTTRPLAAPLRHERAGGERLSRPAATSSPSHGVVAPEPAPERPAPSKPSARPRRATLTHGGAPPAGEQPVAKASPLAAFAEAEAAPQPARAHASLAAEIQLLDRARSALSAGETAQAGALLDAYSSRQPGAVLAQEAAVLRVRLLLARGKRAEASALARRIIQAHPKSSHVDSLRQLANEP